MVDCKDCLHFRRLEGDTVWKRRTGCYHPELLEQSQSERFLQAQVIPGHHEKLNVRGDCAKFSARPRSGSVLTRMLWALKD